MPLKEHQTKENAADYVPLENFRVRTLPVIAPIPAAMGNALASYVLCSLGSEPLDGSKREILKTKTHRKMTEEVKKWLADKNLDNTTFL